MTKSKKSVPAQFTETLTVTVPFPLLQKMRAAAGYWNKGNLNAWLIETLNTAADGELDSMHSELIKLTETHGGKVGAK